MLTSGETPSTSWNIMVMMFLAVSTNEIHASALSQIDSYSDEFHTHWSPEEYKWNPKEDWVKCKLKNNDFYHEILTFIRNPDFWDHLWWHNKSIFHN